MSYSRWNIPSVEYLPILISHGECDYSMDWHIEQPIWKLYLFCATFCINLPHLPVCEKFWLNLYHKGEHISCGSSLAPDCSRLGLSSPDIQSGKVTEAALSWLAQVLSVPNLPKPVPPLADTHHVTKQSEIQDGDFHFLANANKPLRLSVSLLANLSKISLFWYVMGTKVKVVIRAL